jgi:hypothetical protein
MSEKCKECGGSGKSKFISQKMNCGELYYQDCPSCNGTGTTPETALTDSQYAVCIACQKQTSFHCTESIEIHPQCPLWIAIDKYVTAERKRIAHGLSSVFEYIKNSCCEQTQNDTNTETWFSCDILGNVNDCANEKEIEQIDCCADNCPILAEVRKVVKG